MSSVYRVATDNFNVFNVGVCLAFLEGSDGFNEGYDSIALFLAQVVEAECVLVGITLLRVSMPHDCFNDGAGPAVVEAVAGSRQPTTQTASPEGVSFGTSLCECRSP